MYTDRIIGTRVFVALVLLAAMASLTTGCITGGSGGRRGDPIANEFETRMERLNDAIVREDVKTANSEAKDLDSYVARHRKEIELHPEAAMLFTRYDSVKRRLRQLQKVAAERSAAQIKLDAEADVRRPLVQATEIAERVLKQEATSEDVVALRKAIADTQDALNEARRTGKVEVGGEFANEIEARARVLAGTADRSERVARAARVREDIKDARRAVERADERTLPQDKINDYTEARTKYLSCAEVSAKLLAEDMGMNNHELAIEEGKPIPLKKAAGLCEKENKKLDRALKSAEKELKAYEAFQVFLADKSPDQQRIGNEWKRKPNVIRQKKGKTLWVYIDKQKVKQGKRTKTVKTTVEYTFDDVGALLGEEKKVK